MALAGSIVNAAGVWLTVPWIPGPPRRRCGVLSMLHFGGVATCNSFVVFLAWNTEKLLLGRYWGADALGLYGRAYQLVTLPVQQLNGAVTGVAFPALSRIQHDAERLKRSFLRGYSLLISMTIPITITCALFAEEIVRIVLGTKWMAAAPIFRLLAPVALVFAVANPLSWLVMSTGRVGRALSISLATTPLVILGIVLGLSHGPKGVALGYSLAMTSSAHPDRGLVQTRHRNHLGGSMGSHQTTFSVRFAGRCRWLARKARARWQVDANPMPLDGIGSYFRHLCLGAFDSHEAETHVYGHTVPPITTAPSEPGSDCGSAIKPP